MTKLVYTGLYHTPKTGAIHNALGTTGLIDSPLFPNYPTTSFPAPTQRYHPQRRAVFFISHSPPHVVAHQRRNAIPGVDFDPSASYAHIPTLYYYYN